MGFTDFSCLRGATRLASESGGRLLHPAWSWRRTRDMKNANLALTLVASATLAASAAPSTRRRSLASGHMSGHMAKQTMSRPLKKPTKMKPTHAMMKPDAMATRKS